MRTLRTLLTLLLCVTLPYTALASALRDPQCQQGYAPSGAAMTAAMGAVPAIDHDMAGMSMDDPETVVSTSTQPSAAHEMGHCGCLLGCACVQACAAPACNSGLDDQAGIVLVVLKQEHPPVPGIADRRPAAAFELLRPPSLSA